MRLAPPAAAPEGRGANLYLYSMASVPTPRGPQRAPHHLILRYLVTTWAETPEAAHTLLETVLFAALDRTDLEVDVAPLDAQAWQALGARPQPSFFLCVPVRRPRPEPTAKPVRHPLSARSVDIGRLHGVVLGNGDVPVAGARVTMRRFDRSAETDARGRFSLVGVPPDARGDDFVVHARGREPPTIVDLPGSPEDPFVLHVDLVER
ncbi:MAG: hypothetical protein M3326_16750 [Actinomycetota bacterium]|nr:hypothetical protein [Actinomycetota bacterium]